MTLFIQMPFLLYSYLATEMLAPFFASFVIMNCIFFLVKLIPFLDVVLELNIGLADFVRSFSYLFPNMFLYSMPMAAMMGVIIGFTRLSNDTEILALKGCGISIYKMLPPIILVSSVIALTTAYFSIKLIPAGEIAMEQLLYQLAKEKIDKGITQKHFTATLGDLVVYVEHVDKKTNEWKDVWVSDMRGQKTPTITMARTGKMASDLNSMMITIVLNDGSLHRSINKESQIVTFDKYTINIPLTPPNAGRKGVNIGAMTMRELQEKAKFHGENSTYGRRYLMEYHKRLVLPVGCLIVSMLALPLGLQSGPGRRAYGIPLGLASFIVYYVCFTIGKNFAEYSAMPVALAMWVPNLVFVLLTAAAIFRVANEKPLFPDYFHDRILIFQQKMSERKKRKIREKVISTKERISLSGTGDEPHSQSDDQNSGPAR